MEIKKRKFCLGYHNKDEGVLEVSIEEMVEDLETQFDMNFPDIARMNKTERQAIRLALSKYYDEEISYPEKPTFDIDEELVSMGSDYVLRFYMEEITPEDKEFEKYDECHNYEKLTSLLERTYRFVAEFTLIDKGYIFNHQLRGGKDV